MRILFISSNRIGDAVTTTGLLDHLIRTYPQARITVACGPAAEGIFERMPNRERTIILVKSPRDRHWLTLWLATVGHWWDLVVDIRASAFSYLVPARRRVIRRGGEGPMYRQHAAMMGFDPPPLPVVWTAEADRAKATALLPSGRPVVAFGATANWAPKVWPADRFAALFARVQSALLPGAVPAVFSGPGAAEEAMAAPLMAALPGALDCRGTLSIPEAAAVIGQCALFVGNDSGLMHVAAATGAPTVGLFGATIEHAHRMVPGGARADWAIAETATMEAVSVDMAFAACARVLGQHALPDNGPAALGAMSALGH